MTLTRRNSKKIFGTHGPLAPSFHESFLSHFNDSFTWHSIVYIFLFQITVGSVVLMAFLVIFISTINADAKKDGVHHCNDKVRELIMESCKNLNAVYKLRRENRQTHVVNKRANNDANFNADENDVNIDPDDIKIEFLQNKKNKSK